MITIKYPNTREIIAYMEIVSLFENYDKQNKHDNIHKRETVKLKDKYNIKSNLQLYES